MDIRRIVLYAALAFVVLSLWNAWEREYPPVSATTVAASSDTSTNVPPAAITSAQAATAATAKVNVPSAPSKGSLVNVHTDVLDVVIDTQGGNIVQVSLPKYPESQQQPYVPVQLLNNDPNHLYIAQSGLIGANGPDTEQGQVPYKAEKTNYSLDTSNDLIVNLTWQNAQGLQVVKSFTFKRGQYDVGVNYHLINKSAQPWSGQFYSQLQQKPGEISSSIFSLHTYTGGALSSAQEPYEKISFAKMDKNNIDRSIQGGWLAMQQRYFLSTWLPNQQQTNHYYSRVDANKVYTLGLVGPLLNVPAGGEVNTGATFYAGPEIADTLKTLAPHLDLTIDYGWLWPISLAIFWIMKHIFNVVGNWGWAIVLVTLLIKLAFYKLSETSYRSMAKMRNLAPRMQALKERYGDDKQKLSQSTMELYRKEKVNPLGGCLPMIIQIPFFIALYYVLIESVQLRQAPFIFWIHDLSIKDPYYVLPILMGLSMFVQQKLNPAPPDPVQAKVMMLLPVIFTVFFLAFPAGLVLYWLVNNCLSVLQQWYILRRFEAQQKAKSV
jgi:YidC/Oxa1 family membrane protein insertase